MCLLKSTCLNAWAQMSTSQTARHHKAEKIGILAMTRYRLWKLGRPRASLDR